MVRMPGVVVVNWDVSVSVDEDYDRSEYRKRQVSGRAGPSAYALMAQSDQQRSRGDLQKRVT